MKARRACARRAANVVQDQACALGSAPRPQGLVPGLRRPAVPIFTGPLARFSTDLGRQNDETPVSAANRGLSWRSRRAASISPPSCRWG